MCTKRTRTGADSVSTQDIVDSSQVSKVSLTEAYAIFVRLGQKDGIELLQQSQDLSVSQLIKELHNLKIESNENLPEFCVCKEVFYCLLLVGYVFYLSFVFSAAKCHRPK